MTRQSSKCGEAFISRYPDRRRRGKSNVHTTRSGLKVLHLPVVVLPILCAITAAAVPSMIWEVFNIGERVSMGPRGSTLRRVEVSHCSDFVSEKLP